MPPFISLCSGSDITDLQQLSVSLPQVSHRRCCRYRSQRTPKASHNQTQPSVTHIQNPCLSPLRGGGISGQRPCGHSFDLECMRLYVNACCLRLIRVCVCVWRLGVRVPTRPSASGCPRKSFEPSPGRPLGAGLGRASGNVCVCVRAAVRWICVHHGCIWPRGRDRRSEQRVSTKEQQIQCRVQLTHF